MFYEKLCSICQEKGTTPTTLCNDLGLSTSLPTKWKNGADPRISTVQQIADHLNVPVSSFFNNPFEANTQWSRIVELSLRNDSDAVEVLKSLNIDKNRINDISHGELMLTSELYAVSEYFGVDKDLFLTFDVLKHTLNLSSEESEIIIALRSHPELKGVIKRILDLPALGEKSVVS